MELYETGPGVTDVRAVDLVHAPHPVILTANNGDGTVTVLRLLHTND